MAEKKAINVKAVFKRLGGPSEVLRLLAKEGHAITKSGIEKWSARESIPSDWLATLIDIGKKIGKPISLGKCIGSPKRSVTSVEQQS